MVEHICDETKRAVWLPPFDDDKYVFVALGVVEGVVDVDDTEFATRMFVSKILKFCGLLLTTPFVKVSAIKLPPISRVLFFGTRP